MKTAARGVQPRFLTTGTVEGYSMLDRYLMGFAEASEVPPSFLVTGAPAYLLGARPQRGVAFDGGRRDVAIDELIAAEGRRTPDSTVAQRRFRFAFLLVMPAGTNPTAAQLAQVDGYRAQFENFFAKATGNRAFADTSLKKRLQFSLSPAAGVIEGGQVTAILTLAAPSPRRCGRKLGRAGWLRRRPGIGAVSEGPDRAHVSGRRGASGSRGDRRHPHRGPRLRNGVMRACRWHRHRS